MRDTFDFGPIADGENPELRLLLAHAELPEIHLRTVPATP